MHTGLRRGPGAEVDDLAGAAAETEPRQPEEADHVTLEGNQKN